jgi:hypothetical protein
MPAIAAVSMLSHPAAAYASNIETFIGAKKASWPFQGSPIARQCHFS